MQVSVDSQGAHFYAEDGITVAKTVDAPKVGTLVNFALTGNEGDYANAVILYGYALLGGSMVPGACLRVDLSDDQAQSFAKIPVFSVLNDSKSEKAGWILRRHVINDGHIWCAEVPLDQEGKKKGTWHYKEG